MGVRLYDSQNANVKENLRIINNTFRGCGTAIALYGLLTGKIEGNEMYDITGTNAIWVRGIVNFNIENNRMTRVKKPILIEDGLAGETPLISTNVMVKNNYYWDATSGITNNATGVVTIKQNPSFTTENTGTAQITAAVRFVVITHSISVTPSASQISITPLDDMGSSTKWFITEIGATTFKLNVDQVPGSDINFEWRVII